ncbi:MAG: cytidine deaminase [Verrucomicrobiales bacterium]|nr:cytidine deaminase [Verrucomicrobiales bacterium]
MSTDAVTIVLPAVDEPAVAFGTPAGRLILPGRALPERRIPIRPCLISDLTLSAREAATRAYAPYSRFAVGAALIMADDPAERIFQGCNVESASYGATICAERNAIQSAVAAGFRRIALLAVSTAAPADGPVEGRSPCGLCRQVIREFAGADTLIVLDSGAEGTIGEIVDVDRLLPWGFCLET